MPITIATFLWHGWRPIYGAAHVNALARMLRKAMRSPYRLVCVTDDPTGITECETIKIWDVPVVDQARKQNSYVRLRLFDPEIQRLHAFGPRIISIDLDSIILGDLTPLFDMPASFCAVRGHSAPVNGSMFMLKAGTHTDVWRDWDGVTGPERIARTKHQGRPICGSDQAWMSIKIPGAATWGPEHGVYQFSRLPIHAYKINARVVFFAESVKPWDAMCAQKTPELYAYYRQFYRPRECA